MGKKKTASLVFNQDNFDHMLSFILLQAATLGTVVLRLPLISSNSSSDLLASFLFWSGVIPISQLATVGRVNRSRIQAIQSPNAEVFRSRKIIEVLGAIGLLVILLSPFFINVSESAITLIGIPVFIASVATSVYFADALGVAQGLGKNPKLNYVLLLGSFASLGLTWIGYAFGLAEQSTQIQLSFLLDVSLLPILSVYAFTFVFVRKSLIRRNRKCFSFRRFILGIRSDVIEFMFSMPPVLFTAFDLIFLTLFSTDLQVLQYGFYSRCAIVASILPAALYLPLSNRLATSETTTPYQDLKPALVLTIANFPFLIAFVVTAPMLTSFLSSGLTENNTQLILAFTLVSILQPLWIVIQSQISNDSLIRAKVARRILLIVVPISLLASGAGALVLGATGSVLATAISYMTAIAVTVQFYSRRFSDQK
jgi:hypothetical protein